MNWYKYTQVLSRFNQLSKRQDELSAAYSKLFNLGWGKEATPEEILQKKKIGEELDDIGRQYQAEYKRLKPGALEGIEQGRPQEATQQHFVDYHRTGNIASDAYDTYATEEGVSWLGEKSRYPLLVKKDKYGDEVMEFRRENKKLKYVRTDEDREIIRDDKGMATYMSDEEIQENKLPPYETSIVVFNSKDKPIGWASNEFGSDGVWVIKDYQGRGIGTDLLHEFRKQFRPGRRIGQMTSGGENMTRAYHKKLVEEALREGKNVPQEVLEEYELV